MESATVNTPLATDYNQNKHANFIADLSEYNMQFNVEDYNRL